MKVPKCQDLALFSGLRLVARHKCFGSKNIDGNYGAPILIVQEL
jgi:hypothetical protein